MTRKFGTGNGFRSFQAVKMTVPRRLEAQAAFTREQVGIRVVRRDSQVGRITAEADPARPINGKVNASRCARARQR
jgi:hypothetical protein